MIFQGESVRLKALNVLDITEAPITSPSSVTILIKKPDGTSTSITSGWVNDGGGNFHYDLQIGASDPIGLWKHRWTIVNGAYTSIEESSFNVYA